MSGHNVQRYCGADERSVLAQAHSENPDGFQILSVQKLGFLWWRKTVVLVRPLVSTAPQEMRKIRLVSAICAQRELRHQQAAQRDVMSHAHDSNQQPRH